MNLDNITARDIAEVRKALVKCQDLKQRIERGQSCGMDCQEIKDNCEWAEAFLRKVNEIYGPQFPPKSI